MIEQDTIRLLRECDAGVNMGISSIDDVLKYVRSDRLTHALNRCKTEHQLLETEIRGQLDRFGDRGKRPNPVSKKMAGLMTDLKLTVHESDKTIADLMTDGCNMGVKSLNRYLNEFKAADAVSKDIAKRLIHQEERLTAAVRDFL